MPQRKSGARFGQGCPAGLSMAKSAEAENAGESIDAYYEVNDFVRTHGANKG